MNQPRRDLREDIRGAQRVVVKIGSSSLTDSVGRLDHDRLDELVDRFAARRLAGTDVIVVTSGAIASALGVLSLRVRPRDLATQQAAAAVGQGLLMAKYTAAFSAHGLAVGQVLLSAEDLVRRSHYRNAHRTLERLLAMGVVPVVNENDTVATAEIRFGDNDRLAALVAQAVRAEALLLLSDVPGLFSAPPGEPGSALIPVVQAGDDLDQIRIGATGRVGSGGMTTKIEAARIASLAGIPAVLAEAGQARAAFGR